jgi:hypothetical protein
VRREEDHQEAKKLCLHHSMFVPRLILTAGPLALSALSPPPPAIRSKESRLLSGNEEAIAQIDYPVRASRHVYRAAPRANIIRAGRDHRFTRSRVYDYPLMREYAVASR